MAKKQFPDPPTTAVFTTKFVLLEGKDITTVFHFKEDGFWQFSGDDEYEDYEEIAKMTSLGEIIEMDSSVLELADLPQGYCAYRTSKNEPWEIKEFTEE